MSKYTKIILLVLGILAVFGVGGALAVDNICSPDPEIEGLRAKSQELGRSPSEREKLQEILIVSEEDWWQRCRRNLFMTKEERTRIVEEKRRGHEQAMREFAEQAKMASSTTRQVPPSELGILPPLDATILGREFLMPTNSWRGYVNGKLIAVTGTGLSDDPMQGSIFVTENGHVVGSKTYPTPTATGPVKITGENGGVITLESIAGSFEKKEQGTGIVVETVVTPGSMIYYFDLRTRTFQ